MCFSKDIYGMHQSSPKQAPELNTNHSITVHGDGSPSSQSLGPNAHKPRMRWTPELHERFVEAVIMLDGAESKRLPHLPGLASVACSSDMGSNNSFSHAQRLHQKVYWSSWTSKVWRSIMWKATCRYAFRYLPKLLARSTHLLALASILYLSCSILQKYRLAKYMPERKEGNDALILVLSLIDLMMS